MNAAGPSSYLLERRWQSRMSKEGMITDELLDQYRVEGTMLRVVRDMDPVNDVQGIVVAWNDQLVMLRKKNRKIVKLNRSYIYQPLEEERATIHINAEKGS